MSKPGLLLVRPGNKKRLYGSLGAEFAAVEPPMWAGLIAGYMRAQGCSVRLLDSDALQLSAEEVAEQAARERPLLLGVTVSGTNPSASTMNMPEARRILRAVRERAPGLKTFLSGLHPSAVPERTLSEEPADFVVQGEAFRTLPALLDCLKGGDEGRLADVPGLWYRRDGRILSNPPPALIEDLDTLPDIPWDMLPMDRYRAHNWHCFAHPDRRGSYAIVYTSLGCPYTCSFCCINAIFGKPGIRRRSPERVLAEIELLHDRYGVRNLRVMDELFVMNEKHVFAICDGIIERGYDLNIWAYARIDTVSDRMLEKLKAAGFHWLGYGIEAGSPSVRAGVSKGRFGQDEIAQAVRRTKEAGIYVGGNFIFGLPHDTLKTMQQTLELAKDLNCEYANFYVAMAYPGSELYREALEKGLRLPETWEAYSQLGEDTLPLSTETLSPGEILRFRDRAFVEYHSSPRYLEMLGKTFGPAAVENVRRMLQHSVRRRHVTE